MTMPLGTLRSGDGDGDGNGNTTKAIGLISKTTILHVHHDVQGKYRSDNEISSLFLNLDMVLMNSTSAGSPTFDKVSDLE